MEDRKSLRLAAALLLAGLLLIFAVGLVHAEPRPEGANDHVAAFTLYAADDPWTAVHLGQFVAMALVVAGLVALFFALGESDGAPRWAGRFGAGAAVASLALYAGLQAIDGVALKQAALAWANAPESEKAARFASAEAVRWLEWAFRSYQSYLLGSSFVLFASAIVLSARLPRPVGYLMGLTGLSYLAQGWVVGSEGFSSVNTVPTLLGYATWLAWSVWLAVFAWRRSTPVPRPVPSECQPMGAGSC